MRSARIVLVTALGILGGSAALALSFGSAADELSPTPLATTASTALPLASFDSLLAPARAALAQVGVPVIEPAVGPYVGEPAVEVAPVCLEQVEGVITECGTVQQPTGLEVLGHPLLGGVPQPAPVSHEDPAPAGVDYHQPVPLH